MDISRLVCLAQAGDEQAKSDLLQRAAGLVYARVLRSFNDREAADDAAQDVLLAALAGLGRLRDPGAFLAWLRRITDNTVANHLAGRRSRPGGSEQPFEDMPGPGDETSAAVVQAEESQRVRAALAALAPKSRLVIELFYFHDLTCREVADFLRVSHGAARTALSRARKELKRSMTTMTPTSHRRSHYWTMFVSGESTFRGPIFEHFSDTDKLYTALYPAGDDAKAASAGLSRQGTQEQLQLLQDMGLIVRQDDHWRCTMPMVSETDGELIRAWAGPIGDVVIGRLDSIHQKVVGLSEAVAGELTKATVMMIGLVEAASRPLLSLDEQMKVTDPDRGRFGKFRAAVVTYQVPGYKAFFGGYGRGHSIEDGREAHAYYFHPSETRRPGIEALDKAFPPAEGRIAISDVILDKLAAVAHCDLTTEVKKRIADELAIAPARHEEFWALLADLHAVAEREGRTAVSVPTLLLPPWKEYLSFLDGIGAEIEAVVADAADDLRKRTLHCSFADCNFADSVLVFLMYVERIVKQAISERNWVSFPEEADFSWGALIVA